MIEFGKTLREAREAKGMTTSGVAEVTHMLASVITDLENENFSRIPAPIYGRGFVKLYCEAIGLDPKPMIAEFMEIYSGNREVDIKEKPISEPPSMPINAIVEEPIVTSKVEPMVEPTVAPIAKPEIATNIEPKVEDKPDPDRFQRDLFEDSDKENPTIANPLTTPMPSPAPAPAPLPKAMSTPSLARYSAPIRESISSVSLPPNFWRFVIVGAVLIIILWGVGVGLKMLYHATTEPPKTEVRTSKTVPSVKTTPSAKTMPKNSAAPRTTKSVNQLYID